MPWTHDDPIPAEDVPDLNGRPEPLRVRVDRVPVEARRERGEEEQPTYYAGRYRVEEGLGVAPGATRHLAVQEPAVRRVILTILRTDRAREAQEALEVRFLREARILARLRHPCLASVHDVGRASDGTVYATEEAPYGPTFQSLALTRSFPTERLLAVTANLVGALATMHDAGVVHRCLRADAVVVSPGVWRSGAAELTLVGRFAWGLLPEDVASDTDAEDTVAWPPEVLAGKEPNEASDIYAVGALLHLALTGQPQHLGAVQELRAAIRRSSGVRIPRNGDRIGDRLAELAERCLASAPDKRPSARAMLRELEVLARPTVVAPRAASLSFSAVAGAAMVGAFFPTLGLIWLVATREAGTEAVGRVPPAVVARQEALVPPSAPVAAEPMRAPAVEPPLPTRVEAPAAPVAAAPVQRVARVVRPKTTPAPIVEEAAPQPPAPVVELAPPPPPAPVVAAAAEPPKVEPPPAPRAPVVPGAAALSGLWLGKAPGGSLALDLQVSPEGVVSGRARRSDRAGEGVVVGRVNNTGGVLRLELQVTDASGTESYSGEVGGGAVSGRIQAGGRPAGRFTARR